MTWQQFHSNFMGQIGKNDGRGCVRLIRQACKKGRTTCQENTGILAFCFPCNANIVEGGKNRKQPVCSCVRACLRMCAHMLNFAATSQFPLYGPSLLYHLPSARICSQTSWEIKRQILQARTRDKEEIELCTLTLLCRCCPTSVFALLTKHY